MRSFAWILAAAGTCSLFGQGLPAPSSRPIDFSKDVEPIFVSRCSGCHGSGQQLAGLRLDDGEAALKGGKAGPVILPGKSAESKLIKRVAAKTMPPIGDPLTPGQISILRAWVDQGANWPKSKISKRTHWSFQPVVRPDPPSVQKREWIRSPIDAFVLAKLESENIAPSPEASKSTLLRRLSLDLTGLPPTPEEQAAFLNDNRSDAYARLVDRLLASPHYGEKWARPWLDLAHYADSDGYEKDHVRPYAWRYRNWVIDALNRDMPFDEFTIEQLAGDLLPHATVEQRVATGFHRNTLTNREAGVDRAEARLEQLVTEPTRSAPCGWAHGRLRPMPQPQIRSDSAEGLLPVDGVRQQHRRSGHRCAASR